MRPVVLVLFLDGRPTVVLLRILFLENLPLIQLRLVRIRHHLSVVIHLPSQLHLLPLRLVRILGEGHLHFRIP